MNWFKILQTDYKLVENYLSVPNENINLKITFLWIYRLYYVLYAWSINFTIQYKQSSLLAFSFMYSLHIKSIIADIRLKNQKI